MTILQITANPTGLSNVSPRLVYIQTNDTAATVATVGYLNNAVREGFNFQPGDMCLVSTTSTGNLVNSISNYYQAVFTSPNWSLVADVNPGSVLLPVVVGRIATFTNVLGQVGDQAVIATHQGSIQAGSTTAQGSFLAFGAANAGALDHLTLSYVSSTGNRGLIITNAAMGQATTITMPDPGVAAASYLLTQAAVGQTIGTGFLAITSGLLTIGSTGHAGSIGLLPTSALNGQFILSATNTGAGNFTSTLTNGLMGQNTVYTIPDAGNAFAQVLVAATTTPFTANHSLVASGTGGVIADAGYQLKTVAGAAAAGGAAAQSFTDAFCTTGSNVVGNWNTQANVASVLKIVPGNGSFVVTSSADAGVGTFNYIITK